MCLPNLSHGCLFSPRPTPPPAPAPAPPLASCRCGQANSVAKIVGGTTTEANEYPWQVGGRSDSEGLNIKSLCYLSSEQYLCRYMSHKCPSLGWSDLQRAVPGALLRRHAAQ